MPITMIPIVAIVVVIINITLQRESIECYDFVKRIGKHLRTCMTEHQIIETVVMHQSRLSLFQASFNLLWHHSNHCSIWNLAANHLVWLRHSLTPGRSSQDGSSRDGITPVTPTATGYNNLQHVLLLGESALLFPSRNTIIESWWQVGWVPQIYSTITRFLAFQDVSLKKMINCRIMMVEWWWMVVPLPLITRFPRAHSLDLTMGKSVENRMANHRPSRPVRSWGSDLKYSRPQRTRRSKGWWRMANWWLNDGDGWGFVDGLCMINWWLIV